MGDEPARGDGLAEFKPLPAGFALGPDTHVDGPAPDSKVLPEAVRELLFRNLNRGNR